MKNCLNLEVLDIRDNFLKEEAATEMATLIKTISSLRALNLSDCNMEEEENEVIIEALANSTHDF